SRLKTRGDEGLYQSARPRRALEREAQVVDHEDERSRLARLGDRGRSPGTAARARPGGDIAEEGHVLLLPVLEDLEVLRTQVHDGLAVLVRDHRVDLDEVGGDP